MTNLWKIWVRQIGIIIPKYIGENKIHVPNHQPANHTHLPNPEKQKTTNISTYINIYQHISTYINIYQHISTYINIPSYQHTNISTYLNINIPTYQHTNISTYQHINISTYQHINISTYQHINIPQNSQYSYLHQLSDSEWPRILHPGFPTWSSTGSSWIFHSTQWPGLGGLVLGVYHEKLVV